MLLREVVVALGANEPEGMFLDSVKLETEKVNLDLSGRPTRETKRAGSGSSGDAKSQVVHQQIVWPEVIVMAVIQKELIKGRVGDAVNTYQSKLQVAAAKLDVDGFGVEFVPESERGGRFKMTFRLKVKSSKTEGEN